MTKAEILEFFEDINFAYNDCSMYDGLSIMLDKLEQELKTEVLDKIAAEIKNIEYLSCPQPYVVLNDVLGIIDKYKTESEG